MLSEEEEIERINGVKFEVLLEMITSMQTEIARKSELEWKDPDYIYLKELRSKLVRMDVSEIDYDKHHAKLREMRDFYKDKPQNAAWQAICAEYGEYKG